MTGRPSLPRGVVGMGNDLVDPFHRLATMIFFEPSCGDGGRAHADTRGGQRRFGVEGDHILVDGNISSPNS